MLTSVKVLKSVCALSLLAIFPVALASAETVSVAGGSLTITNTPLTFQSITLNLSASQTSTASTTLSAQDDRGTGAGWSITLSATDFVSDSIADPSGGSGNVTVKIPITAVSFTVGSVSSSMGQAIDPTYGPKATTSGTLSTSAQRLLNASPGYGMGAYTATADFMLTLPKTTTVNTVSGTGSKYTVGTTVGVIASTYTSTFTFTSAAGI